jgi:hypothetical protein
MSYGIVVPFKNVMMCLKGIGVLGYFYDGVMDE